MAQEGVADDTDIYVGLDEIGDANTRSKVSRKISRTPSAVLADDSTNSAPMRAAYAAASAVGICRVCPCEASV